MFYIDIIHWSFILTIFRLILGGVFLTSAISKVIKIYNFELTIKAFNLTPQSWSKFIAFFIIITEAIVSILLLAGWKIQLAALASNFLLVVFIIAISVNLLRKNNNFDCGCFGNLHSSTINTSLIWRNLCLLAISSSIVFWNKKIMFNNIFSLYLNNISIESVLLPFSVFIVGLYIFFLLLQRFYYIMRTTLKFKEEK